jgi:hypothetical protein
VDTTAYRVKASSPMLELEEKKSSACKLNYVLLFVHSFY